MRERFPYAIDEIEHEWIPVSDGVRLASRQWRPRGIAAAPAILDVNPYGKRAGTRERDERMYRWFAGHGYACVRLDVRGTGDSQGTLEDEYTLRQQQDGFDAVEWIASQPWCDGAVGIIGKSWGGITALQIAALQPPSLRAVIAVCATDDRWTTDAHWMGGALLCENLSWGAMLMAVAASPPDPAVHGAAWRQQWLARLDAVRLWPALWMQHPSSDRYWSNGSVARHLDRIRCPVYAVSGWMDAYADVVPRLLAGLRVPCKGLVGPWAHEYPHEARDPSIGFLQEANRWWAKWLRGEATGIEREPAYRVWMTSHPRHGDDGRWIAEASWPASRIEERTVPLEAAAPRLRSDPTITVGQAAVPWCCFGFEPELWPDQSIDGARSLVLDTEPLVSRLEILGAPRVQLDLSTDRATPVIVRLCDVAPNGDSVRVSYAVTRVPADFSGLLEVELRHAAHAFTPGHRVRVAVSATYWPVVWPAPEPVTLETTPVECRLVLPVRPLSSLDSTLAPFGDAEWAAADPREDLDPFTIEVSRRPENGEDQHLTRIEMSAEGHPARSRFPTIDLETGHGIAEEFRIRPGTPETAQAVLRHALMWRRGEFQAEIDLEVRVRARERHWHLEATLSARDRDGVLRERRWVEDAPQP
jgi:putative CocE/NonD family hydrolase